MVDMRCKLRSLFCLLFIVSCAPNIQPSRQFDFPTPYSTKTANPTSTPNIVVSDTPLPTSTPFVYTIQSGDTFSELAEKFKISQDDLRAANPDVKPNSMTIGAALLIPDSSSAAAVRGATPTPAPVPVTQTVCHPTADHGLWCFALIENNTSDILENVSAQITLLDENNNALASQTAFMPLDIIPPNASLPVYVFFPNTPAAQGENVQVQILSAMQSNTSRYLPATLHNTIAQIDWNGLTAQLSGQIHLPAESTAATQVWVAAVAYDKDGRVVGLKRWEGGAIQPGGSIPFSFLVSSLGPVINAVEFVVEAKP
jgi:LysM repeat protein